MHSMIFIKVQIEECWHYIVIWDKFEFVKFKRKFYRNRIRKSNGRKNKNSFIGNQYKNSVDDKDYFIDMLFYHTKLHCYIVVELKNTEYKPEYAGKLNFYLSAVDDLIKTDSDNPTIGIILCRETIHKFIEWICVNFDIGIGDTLIRDFERETRT